MVTNLFSLSGHSFKEVAGRTWEEVRKDDVFARAAQLAYYFFLALFPFLICVIASLSVFGLADRGRELLFQFFAGALPPSAFELLNATFTDIIRAGGPLKMSFGLVVSLWSASMGMSAVMDTLNAAYDVKESRSLLKQYAVAVGLTLGIALLLVISAVIVLFGDTIVDALSHGGMIAERLENRTMAAGPGADPFRFCGYLLPCSRSPAPAVALDYARRDPGPGFMDGRFHGAADLSSFFREL